MPALLGRIRALGPGAPARRPARRPLAARGADPRRSSPAGLSNREIGATLSSASTPRPTTSAASCARPTAPTAPRPPPTRTGTASLRRLSRAVPALRSADGALHDRARLRRAARSHDDDVELIEEINAGEGVRWLFSFLSADRRRTYCLYEAPSPDAIVAAARRANVPADAIVEVGPATLELAGPPAATGPTPSHGRSKGPLQRQVSGLGAESGQ